MKNDDLYQQYLVVLSERDKNFEVAEFLEDTIRDILDICVGFTQIKKHEDKIERIEQIATRALDEAWN